jgi:hypothetical protein
MLLQQGMAQGLYNVISGEPPRVLNQDRPSPIIEHISQHLAESVATLDRVGAAHSSVVELPSYLYAGLVGLGSFSRN